MAIFRRASLLSILLLTPKALSLQVTPNSPCATLCMDDPSQNISDPNTSNTYPSDIVCADADYENTPVGRKFESCVNCLRNSTATGAGENDQSWFLYNIRYGLASCVFGFTNVSDAQSTPCSTDTSCGPLQQALENGNLVPNNESTYSYCSADNNALLGSSLGSCISCLQDDSTETYLANFVMVLQAGCVEQPTVGTNIGIRGNIFSSTLINITFPGDNPSSSANNTSKKNGLTEGAIIGIVVGLVVLAIFAIALLFICYRKRRYNKSIKRLTSPLDPRFGSKNISSPNSGAYGNPYASPPTEASQKFDPSALSAKELQALELQIPNFSKQYPNARVSSEEDGSWQDAHAHLEATQGALPSYAIIPIHQAYIPATHAPVSPATSTNTSNTYQMSSYPSSRSSPNMIPPPAAAPTPAPAPAPVLPRAGIKAIPPPIRVPQPRTQTTPQQVQPAHFPPQQQQEETSQVARPTLHSQQAAIHPPVRYPAMAETRPASVANSIAGTWNRARSMSRNGRNRSTSRNGGRNRSTSRNGFRDTYASMDVPVRISGPMIRHGGRFDFDFDENERMEKEGMEGGRSKADATPSSAESEEQWPGLY